MKTLRNFAKMLTCKLADFGYLPEIPLITISLSRIGFIFDSPGWLKIKRQTSDVLAMFELGAVSESLIARSGSGYSARG